MSSKGEKDEVFGLLPEPACGAGKMEADGEGARQQRFPAWQLECYEK